MRNLLVSMVLWSGVAFAAGPAQTFADAVQKKDAKAAAKLVTPSLRYGADGRDGALAAPAEKTLAPLFKALEKTFKGLAGEVYDCTRAGRELGFMATEWQESNSALADWVRGLAERHCTGNEPVPPSFLFVKRVDGDHPHALVLVESGEDTPALLGFYHF